MYHSIDLYKMNTLSSLDTTLFDILIHIIEICLLFIFLTPLEYLAIVFMFPEDAPQN